MFFGQVSCATACGKGGSGLERVPTRALALAPAFAVASVSSEALSRTLDNEGAL